MNKPEEQILIELKEEANIDKGFVSDIKALCLLYDAKGNVYDIGYKIAVRGNLSLLLKSGKLKSEEYNDLRVINIHELLQTSSSVRLLPTSASLICHLAAHLTENGGV
jgi:hypothetical protein